MKKNIALIFVLLFCTISVFPRQTKNDSIDKTKNKQRVLFPTKSDHQRLRSELMVQYAFLRLKTHPALVLENDSYQAWLKERDTLTTGKIVHKPDSLIITLKSGLSWNLAGEFPKAPKNFYLKMLTKKGREETAVSDWLKYLELFKKNGNNNILNFEIIERYNYTFRYKDGNKLYEMSFEFKHNFEGKTKMTKKEINYY